MHHHVVAYIQSAMGYAVVAVRIFAQCAGKEDDIAGFRLAGADVPASAIQPCRAHVADAVHTCFGEQP